MSQQGYGAFTVAGQFNLSPPAPVNGQIVPLQLDSQGNLLVNVAVGGGSGSNLSVGVTGANVPGSATYVGADNPSGKLTGLAVDASGNLLVNIAAGGSSGAQFAMGSAQSSSALGTIALGYDGANVRGLLTDTTGQLKVLVENTVPVTLTSTTITGTVAVTQSTSPWVVSLASTTITGTVAVTQSTSPWVVSLASTTITGTVAVTQSTSPWVANIIQWDSVALGAPSAYGTSPGAVNVPGVNAFITNTPAVTLASTTITGAVAVTQSTSPWTDNVSQFGGSNVVTGTGISGAGIPRVTVSSDSFPATQPVSAVSLPLPANAAQETGGNLSYIVTQTRNDAQIVDLLNQLLAQAKYQNILLASSSTADMDDPDLISQTLMQ